MDSFTTTFVATGQSILPGTITIDGLILGGLVIGLNPQESYYDLDVEAARSILGQTHTVAPDAPATVVGSEVNNLILGGAGDDTIDGGGGYNIVAYSQPEQLFTVTLHGTALTVEDRSHDVVSTPINLSHVDSGIEIQPPHSEGIDTLTNIQQITFSDGSMLDTSWLTKAAALPADQMGALVDLYTAYFDRAPDAVGLDYWASRFSDGMSLQQIAKSFFDQPETVATFPASMSDQDFVTKVYNNVLGRAPDQTGFDYWINQLQTGKLTKDVFILAVIGGAQASTGSPIDAQYLANKQAVGEHFAIDQGLGDMGWATNVMAHVDATAASVAAANALTDGYATAAATSDPHLVVQLVGINTTSHR